LNRRAFQNWFYATFDVAARQWQTCSMPKLFAIEQDINEVRAAYGILAPCPFCGSREVEAVSHARGFEIWFVTCFTCHAIGPEPAAGHQGDPTTKAEAIAAWNRRSCP
jgi:Lar family restriction alleviation protein